MSATNATTTAEKPSLYNVFKTTGDIRVIIDLIDKYNYIDEEVSEEVSDIINIYEPYEDNYIPEIEHIEVLLMYFPKSKITYNTINAIKKSFPNRVEYILGLKSFIEMDNNNNNQSLLRGINQLFEVIYDYMDYTLDNKDYNNARLTQKLLINDNIVDDNHLYKPNTKPYVVEVRDYFFKMLLFIKRENDNDKTYTMIRAYDPITRITLREKHKYVSMYGEFEHMEKLESMIVVLDNIIRFDYALAKQKNEPFYIELNKYILKPERVEKMATTYHMEFCDYLDAIMD